MFLDFLAVVLPFSAFSIFVSPLGLAVVFVYVFGIRWFWRHFSFTSYASSLRVYKYFSEYVLATIDNKAYHFKDILKQLDKASFIKAIEKKIDVH